MPIFASADRVKDTTTTTGTGSYTLDGSPPAGFQSFSAGIGTGNICRYAIEDGTDWETGLGTLSAATTLARTTILDSSNAGAAVDWGAGTKDISVSALGLLDSLVAVNVDGTSGLIGANDYPGAAGALALGFKNVASGLRSLCAGSDNAASGLDSVALGENNTASDDGAVGIGDSNTASGFEAVAIGFTNTASGYKSVAIGGNNTAADLAAVALGDTNNIDAPGSIGLGYYNTCTVGDAAFLAGSNNTITASFNGIAIGQGNTVAHDLATCLGDSVASRWENALHLGGRATADTNGANAWAVSLRLVARTDDATATALRPANRDSVTGEFEGSELTDHEAAAVCAVISAISETGADQKAWEVKFLIYGGATPTLVGSVSKTVIAESAGATAWDVSVNPTGTNSLIEVTGLAATGIAWGAHVQVALSLVID